METPLYDFLKRYAAGNTVRLHMPGHKGHHPDSALQEMARYDITEIAGADSLFEAEGVIREAERNTAALYETGDTCFLAGGSTLGIQTMLACCCMPGDTVLAARNAHKAFINTCALLDLNVQWLLPNSRDSFGVSGTVDAQQVREALAQGGIKAVYITSPDYMGFMSDIKAIADVCREYGLEERVIPCDYDFNMGLTATEELLRRFPDVDGIVACNDMVAISAYKVLHKLGISVPDQIQIVGFDGIHLSSLLSPELTTVAQPIHEIGVKATELIIHNDPLQKGTKFVYPAALIVRETTKKKESST